MPRKYEEEVKKGILFCGVGGGGPLTQGHYGDLNSEKRKEGPDLINIHTFLHSLSSAETSGAAVGPGGGGEGAGVGGDRGGQAGVPALQERDPHRIRLRNQARPWRARCRIWKRLLDSQKLLVPAFC